MTLRFSEIRPSAPAKKATTKKATKVEEKKAAVEATPDEKVNDEGGGKKVVARKRTLIRKKTSATKSKLGDDATTEDASESHLDQVAIAKTNEKVVSEEAKELKVSTVSTEEAGVEEVNVKENVVYELQVACLIENEDLELPNIKFYYENTQVESIQTV